MSKSERYLSALDEMDLFENSGHRTRFKELVDCYGSYPFFSRNLCKCMYLSAWDEEHFATILSILSDLAIGKERNTQEMRLQGDSLAEQEGGECYVYQLSNAFLDGREFVLEGIGDVPEEYMYIIRQGIKAGQAIDRAKEEEDEGGTRPAGNLNL